MLLAFVSVIARAKLTIFIIQTRRHEVRTTIQFSFPKPEPKGSV